MLPMEVPAAHTAKATTSAPPLAAFSLWTALVSGVITVHARLTVPYCLALQAREEVSLEEAVQEGLAMALRLRKWTTRTSMILI